ncbi:MAG: DUF4340 domain-containing protein [Akkermansia sp.]|nr:DUF4340 domain-containing protein [Akkermansia sp.]
MRLLRTIVLFLLAAGAISLCAVLATDGNLARVTGWYHFDEGMPLFGRENSARPDDVTWMRIADLHDTIECERDDAGNWWIIKPFRDRMSPAAVREILRFTAEAKVLETLPNNRTTRRNMREYGVETNPVTITLKVPDGEGKDELTAVARYTLGNASPWLADAGNGEDVIPTTYLRTDFYGRDKRIHVVSGNIQKLFKDGLEALRDPHPLLFDPDSLRDITITPAEESAKPLHLRRLSSEAAWTITAPVITAADEDKVNTLVQNLMNIAAVRVDDAADITLPAAPLYRIQLQCEGSDTPQEITLYPAFEDAEAEQRLCYATVNNRPVVFTLQAARKVHRKGSYAALLNAATELPVLPDKALAQVRMSRSTIYTDELDLTLPALRSLRLADIDPKDISRVALVSPANGASLRLRLIPGDADNQVEDTWLYSAPQQSRRHGTAENATVRNFLKSISSIPAEEVVADALPGEDIRTLRALYGLDRPTYLLFLQPNPCAVRATIFGQDLPLVKDRRPRTFAVSRAQNPATGKLAWFGAELGSDSVCRLSPKFTRLLSLRAEKWKNRSLADFPISSVRRLTLDYQEAPLVLDYDYIGESWTGKLKDEDVTPRINPHRAEHYLRRLQKLKVAQWLEADDPDALAALEKPVFAVKLELEITDYSDAEATVIEAQESAAAEGSDAESMLSAADAEDQRLRDLALAERRTHAETRTLQISPSDYDSDTPYFYGRLVETGELFILNFEDAQGLAGDMLDM